MRRPASLFATLFCLAAVCLASAVSAKADPLTVTIHNPEALQTTPGSSILLSGTLTNNTASVLFVNSSGGALNINQPPGSHIVLDAHFFIRPNLTTYVLQPGQTTGVIPLMTLSINPAAPNPSLTSGRIDICGGVSAAACDNLGSAQFTVGVGTSPVVPAPEPATLLLLTTGLAGVAGAARRRRRARGRG